MPEQKRRRRLRVWKEQKWRWFGPSVRGAMVDGKVYALLWWEPSVRIDHEDAQGQPQYTEACWVLSFLDAALEGTVDAPPPPEPLTGDMFNDAEMDAFYVASQEAAQVIDRRLAGEESIWTNARHPRRVGWTASE
jgi:hypothetical protein